MPPAATLEPAPPSASGGRNRRLRWQLLVLLVVLGSFMVFGPAIAPYGPTEIIPGARQLPPSWTHPFGTDINAMDVLSRVLHAAPFDLGIAFAATALAFVLGYPLGLITGYFSGLGNSLLLRLLDMVQSFPALIFALTIVALTGNRPINIVYAAAFVFAPVMARVVRSIALSVREERFVEAAVAGGSSTLRVFFRHLVPHTLGLALVQSTIVMSRTIIIIASLSFVGVGVQPPTAEWGSMVQVGARSIVTGQWWESLFPGLAIAVAVLAFSRLGSLLQRMFDIEGTLT